MKNVLSIDWDYFFPPFEAFSWTASEIEPAYFESAWAARANDRPLRLGGPDVAAANLYRASLALADKVLRLADLSGVTACRVSDSHGDIIPFLKSEIKNGEQCIVTNYDQHHDWQYNQRDQFTSTADSDCANWASALVDDGTIAEYRVVYPPWRKSVPEQVGASERGSFKVSYEAAVVIPDIVFVCRSPVWTPPWQDVEWLNFASRIRSIIPCAAEHTGQALHARRSATSLQQSKPTPAEQMLREFELVPGVSIEIKNKVRKELSRLRW